MFFYRERKGGLAESMKTLDFFTSKQALIDKIQSDLDVYGKGVYDASEIEFKPYGFDARIGWDVYLVTLKGYGVLGFTDGPVDI